MNYDITFCVCKECPKALKCKRSIIHVDQKKVSVRWLSMSEFSPMGDECKYFWNIDEKPVEKSFAEMMVELWKN